MAVATGDTPPEDVRGPCPTNGTTTNTESAPAPARVTEQLVDDAEVERLVREEAMALPDLNLVVSGLAGRFPKANSLHEFEENLRLGVDMITDNDNTRFTPGLWGLPPRAGRLRDLVHFDEEFFGLTTEEANYTDYQMRLLYEVVYESLLDAGLQPAELRGSNTGVFFGLHCNEFENAMADDPGFKTGGYYAQFAVKVAQYFDFRGITVTFDAACASGAVGLHNAVDSLRAGHIDQAVVCSCNIPIHPTGSFIFLQMQMLSPTGYSRFLDSRADGYVKSEACVSVVLQRKQVARRNYASLMNTMSSVDGYKPEGITFPSDESQERLIRAAKEAAALHTNHVEYLEAHGTGTPAGDPQEARAISGVYFPLEEQQQSNGTEGQITQQQQPGAENQQKEGNCGDQHQDKRLIGPLLVGSVKTNMGHSEAASGLCALAKVVLMLENELIYKSLHFDQPNTNIESLMDGRLRFVDETRRLRGKIVPISCYGFGGTNVHAILRANERPTLREGAFHVEKLYPNQRLRLVVMFGRSAEGVNKFFDQMLDVEGHNTRHCLSEDFLSLVDNLSARTIDRLMSYRGFLLLDGATDGDKENWPPAIVEVGRSVAECKLAPATMEDVQESERRAKAHFQESKPRACNLLLPGLGCQWRGMAAGLRHFEPFWSTIERLATILEPFNDQVNLISLLLSEPPAEGEANDDDDDEWDMCSLFVTIVGYQMALVNMFTRQLKPNKLESFVGHSMGELACAYAAGHLDEQQTILLAYQLGKTLDDHKQLIAGKMVALEDCSRAQACDLLAWHHKRASRAPTTLQVSCVNGPTSVTISGSHEDMETLCATLRARNEPFKLISERFALHNDTIMTHEAIGAELRAAVAKVLLNSDQLKTQSDNRLLSGRWLCSGNEHSQVNVAEYFAQMLCKQVDLERSLCELRDDSILLELGPCNLFESQVLQVKASSERAQCEQSPARGACRKFHHVRSMLKNTPPKQQAARLMQSMGELYLAGATFDLARFYYGQEGAEAIKRLPVRRQTPSLGALFRWSHKHEHFVPRYPLQFSKSSAKSEMPIDIVQDRDKYLLGHCIEGRVLFPATGYLFLIWRVFSFTKRRIYDACFHDVERELLPVEFRDVRLLRAVILGNRVAQVYIHYEEATGRFEIKEGGSVVVEGYAFSPESQPDGLLNEEVRERLRAERLETTLSSDDIYKQFRVSGYDYGETFRNIECCSQDGRYARIKHNGHFVALTDSILQCIFLAVSQYAPSGGLFLPTRFDYVRFQPDIILAKLRAAGAPFDLADGALDTKAKREIMTKMMQRDKAARVAPNESQLCNQIIVKGQPQVQVNGHFPDGQEQEHQQQQVEMAQEKAPECIFETYCDPVTGVIITDGIEMRGIKATPAPRRSDSNEVHLESYQFVRDFEEPLVDENLTKFASTQGMYAQVCDSLALRVLAKLCSTGGNIGTCGAANGNERGQQEKQRQSEEAEATALFKRMCAPHNAPPMLPLKQVDAYKNKHLKCVYNNVKCLNMADVQTVAAVDDEKATSDQQALEREEEKSRKEAEEEKYDIKKNGQRTLLSVLDQLASFERLSVKQVRERIKTNRNHLMRDLLQAPMASERFVRPLVETILENVCSRKSKLRLIEVNQDDALMRPALQHLLQQVDPNVALDYSLAHPEPSRLGASATADAPNVHVKTHTLRELTQLFEDQQLKNLDLVVYKDISCYSLPKQVVEQNGLAPVMASLRGAVRAGGYILLAMRKSLTFAERVLLSLSEPELVGLSKRDLDHLLPPASAAGSAYAKIERINAILESRCEAMLAEAKLNNLLCVARKADPNGCCLLLFRYNNSAANQQAASAAIAADSTCGSHQEPDSGTSGQKEKFGKGPLVLRVRHDELDWLDQLKANFAPVKAAQESEQTPGVDQQVAAAKEEKEQQVAVVEPRLVWLCAVATRDNPISGLVGMMQSLRRELGTTHLRCFHDAHTFSERAEPVSVEQIERSPRFREALERDHLWCCVDAHGYLGSYRHFTINDYLSYASSACNEHEDDESLATETYGGGGGEQQVCVAGAYANNATRGDLSSFCWFEAPFRYLSARDRANLVRVAYSALNFRDIMLATGRLPLDAIPLRLAMADCLLGLEFSGFDAAGKRVMGMVYGRGIATHIVCPRESAILLELPECLSLEEAATIPVVYATAIMALIYRGKMRPGERLLVHAGSGGVGQAAIRLAQHFGVEVFATVGSQEKRAFLRQEFKLGDDHIFNSRDCHFEEQIMRATRGAGVDLVLNSLADDKLQASIRCLADGGRFLEIGKYDMSVDARLELHKLDVNKTFHGILLDKLFDSDNLGPAFQQQLKCVLETLREGLAKGFVRPIKHKLFKRHQVEQAFRFMATGKHIGKVLIEIEAPPRSQSETKSRAGGRGTVVKVARPPPSPLEGARLRGCVPRFQLAPDKSYLVTGGLGGFGLELCKWLVVSAGARHLVITSRSGLKTGYQRTTLDRLRTNSGATITIVVAAPINGCPPSPGMGDEPLVADATTREGARKLVEICRKVAPTGNLGGVFHLAMVLRDTLLENMTREDFEQVCRPKVDTCLHLDAATRALQREPPLDCFVAFSSVTSGKGNAGQANYAYANSCLERVCEQRRASSLHGLAIQWGAIGDVGVAYENLGGNEVIIGGTRPQRMPSCLATLGRLLCSPFATCLSVVPVTRNTNGTATSGDLVGAIFHVLGIKDSSKVSEDSTLADLGLDSLMAVEIRQYIEREYERTLNIQEIRSLTIAKIREISESEKPSADKNRQQAAAAAQQKAQVKQVDSYANFKNKEVPPTVTAATPAGPPKSLVNGCAPQANGTPAGRAKEKKQQMIASNGASGATMVATGTNGTNGQAP